MRSKREIVWASLFVALVGCAAPVPAPSPDRAIRLPTDAETPEPTTSTDPTTPAPTPTPSEALYDSPEVDAFFEKKLVEAGLPGMSAAVIRGGKTKWAKGYGFADIAKQKKADKDTIYMLASVSKTVVAVALMQLVEDPTTGVTLDTDVSTKLPFTVRNPRFPSTPITVRMLATHTSSLGDYYTYEAGLPGDPQVSLATWATNYVAQANNWAEWRPGTTWEYSNSATSLAALVVENVTKTDFAEYCEKKIFEPLAMKETSWFLKGLDVSKIAVPHDGIAPAFVPLKHYGYPEYPSGQLRSSATQMARFLAMVHQKGELEGARVLKAETVAEMTRMQVPNVEPSQGVFFYQLFHGNVLTLGHDGADLGVSTLMFFDPTDGAGYVMLTNGSPDAYWANGGVSVPETMLAARDQIQLELLDLAKRIP
jgi:CubicO group peptidase (beta-lactamase class C family)